MRSAEPAHRTEWYECVLASPFALCKCLPMFVPPLCILFASSLSVCVFFICLGVVLHPLLLSVTCLLLPISLHTCNISTNHTHPSSSLQSLPNRPIELQLVTSRNPGMQQSNQNTAMLAIKRAVQITARHTTASS